MRFKDLLRYRQAWLGVALIWIILYHCPLDFGPLGYLKAIGYGGVDICLFASGIGCFYSLSSVSNVVEFMKRRVKRLVPTYIIFMIVWLAYQYILGNFGFQMAVGNLLALQNFTGHKHSFNWYISAIFLFYILAPYFKIIVERASSVRKIVFLVFLLVCSIPFWKADTYIITITRLPIFYIGMVFADMCKNNKQIKGREIIGMVAAFILGIGSLLSCIVFAKQYLWSYGLYWYPFILITPGLCVAISYVSMMLERTKIFKPIVSFLSLCGDYSFELYLVHILLISVISAFIEKYSLSNIRYFLWAAGIVCLFIGCFMLRRLTQGLSRLCGNIRSVQTGPQH